MSKSATVTCRVTSSSTLQLGHVDVCYAVPGGVLLESHALLSFPQEGFSAREERIRDVWEVIHRITSQIDLMSPSRIVSDTELLEDSLVRLAKSLGFRLRRNPIPPVPEVQYTDYVGSELLEISDRRMRLVGRMQEDLALYGGSSRLGRELRTITPKSLMTDKYRALKYGPVKRDQDKFLVDDGRYS